MYNLTEILSYMKTVGTDNSIQKNQTAHRMRLIEQFDIQVGDYVLEIGSGQGDTTAALAAYLGPNGKVHAIDIASPDYGAPLTLGEATTHIKQSDIGSRITFDFETDLLHASFSGTYDVAVLSHSLFYFKSHQQILDTFKKVRLLAKKICIAEWDIVPYIPAQMAHSQAILIQSLYNQYVQTDGNIQNLLTIDEIEHLLVEAGWTIGATATVDAKQLLDGQWEVDSANYMLETLDEVPENIRPTFIDLGKWLSILIKRHPVQSCNSMVINAYSDSM